MKRSISLTSALLLLRLLLRSAFAETTVVAKMEDELEDLDTTNKNDDDIVHAHTHQLEEKAEKGHQRDVRQDKSLISQYTHHYRNVHVPLSEYLHRILVQTIQFPQVKFNRKSRKSDVAILPEEGKGEQQKQQAKYEPRMNNNQGQKNVGFVKGMGNSIGNFHVEDARWVRAWCPPPNLKTSEGDDKSIEVVGTEAYKPDKTAPPNANGQQNEIDSDSSNSGGEEDDDLQPQVVFFVSNSDSRGGGNSALSSIGGSACLTVLGQQYDNSKDIVQYTLLQQKLHLGNIDVHKRDFAYHPVVANLETRLKDEEKAVEAFGTKQSSRTKRDAAYDDNEHDRQVSFRWWSWVVHLSQMLQSGHIFHNTVDKKKDNYNKQHSSYQSSIYEEVGKSAFAGGSHGEVWRARRRCPSVTADNEKNENSTRTTPFSSSCDDGKDLIVKRLKIELGYSILEAGLREVYFGELLAREVESSNYFTTYVDHFFREGRKGQVELWIVFENAGPSLRSYMYEATVADGFVIFQHSAFWRRLRMGISDRVSGSRSHKTMDDNSQSRDGTNGNGTSEEVEGRYLLKEVLKQILKSVAFLHERGITHRDIKPSNILCLTSPSPQDDNIIPDVIEEVNCVLADFSSAYDDFVDRNLYGNGPSSNEQTDEYAPPEVLLQGLSPWEPFSSANPYSYDSWSIGVLALELLLGTPNVFSVDQRTTALLTNKLQNEGATSGEIRKALYLAALSQFCIYVPTSGLNWPLRKGDPLNDISVAKHSCTLHDFHNALRARDPLGVGFQSSADLLLHLIWRLLDWDPLTRISPADALLHPYFTLNNHRNNRDDEDKHSPPAEKLLFRKPLNDFMIPGSHNALEHQTLDPRLDMNSSDTISDFVCPKCGKKFSDHNSCQMHARSRKHGLFCTYDVTLLPQCIHTHSMLPTHSTSGYCDIQGRRKTIEDFHTIHLNQNQQFYGIFDGHMGNIASKFSASSFYDEVRESLSTVDEEIQSSNSDEKWKDRVKLNMEQSFYNLHEGILEAIASSPTGVMREAGTTATILHVTDLAVVIANVGDSRAVLSSWVYNGNEEEVTGIQLTVDHVASSPEEQDDVIERGGFISKSGGIDRVNGSLAVSRSLGDVKLAPYLSQNPHVMALTKDEVHKSCRNDQSLPIGPDHHDVPCFIIVASDGLWDVVDNQEAVKFVAQVLRESNESLQTAAQMLTQEAYVRGSSDNIGVLIVAL